MVANSSDTAAELEAVERLASARDTLDRALIGDPTWLRADVMDALADLVRAGARWLPKERVMSARRCRRPEHHPGAEVESIEDSRGWVAFQCVHGCWLGSIQAGPA